MPHSVLPFTPPVFGWMIRGQGALFVGGRENGIWFDEMVAERRLIADLSAPEVRESVGFWKI